MQQRRPPARYRVCILGVILAFLVGIGRSAPLAPPRPPVALPEIDPLEVSGDLRVAGSTILAPLINALYKRFIREGYRGVIKLDSTGTAQGFRLFCEKGMADIAMASRRIQPQESERCIANGRTPTPFHIATDTLTVVVNRANAFIEDVSLADLPAILIATHWSDVNSAWPQEKIHRFMPDASSSDFRFIGDTVLEGQAATLMYAPNTTLETDPKRLAQGISLHPYAIGVLGYAYYREYADYLKLLTIENVRPTVQSVMTSQYPLTRPLILYTDPVTLKAKSQVKAFLNFNLNHVHETLSRLGYFPASARLFNMSRTSFLQVFGYPSRGRQALSSQDAARGSEAKTKITIADQGYDASRAIAHVLKNILESRFGLKVGIVQASMDVIIDALDKGEGAIDVLPELTMPNHSDKWTRYIAPGSRESIHVNRHPYTSVQGLFVPGYIQDKHGVRNIQDLLSPEIAKLFDSDGDGKGEFWPGAPGWGATPVELVKARSYGYAKYFEPQVVDEVVFKAKLKARYAQKQGILFYSWTPEWIHAVYDLRRLNEPPFTGYAMPNQMSDTLYNAKGCWRMVFPSQDQDWLRKSQVTCAWPKSQMYVAFASALTQRLPMVAQFLRQVALDPQEIAKWIRQIGVQQHNPADVAREWIRRYPDLVEPWLVDIDM